MRFSLFGYKVMTKRSFEGAGRDQMWCLDCTWKRVVLLQQRHWILSDSGPWGLCFFEPLVPACLGKSPCSRWGLGCGTLVAAGIRAPQERQRLLSNKPGFSLRKREELKSVQLLPPTPLFSGGSFPILASGRGATRRGWRALAGSTARPGCVLR